jgi:hypothetical protein
MWPQASFVSLLCCTSQPFASPTVLLLVVALDSNGRASIGLTSHKICETLN